MSIRLRALFVVLPLFAPAAGWGADLVKGQDAYNSGDYQTALTEWQVLADEGDANAQFGMGLLYANGFGVSLDDSLALKWYTSAADQGHAEAQCNIAVMYANGWGVTQSDAEAFKWYSLAAEGGIAQAQVNLAKMYSKGFGVAKDNVMAHKWLAIASELGDYGASSKRDELAAKMSAEEIAQAGGLASAWIESHQNLLAAE
jgi:TPR repeat protein